MRPQLGDLPALDLTCHTVRGPIAFSARRERNVHHVTVALPAGCAGELLLPEPGLEGIKRLGPHPLGLVRHALPAGQAAFDLPAV